MKSFDDEFEDLLWRIERSIRYHERRQGFFEQSDRVISALSLLLSSGAFIALMKEIPATIAGVALVLLSILAYMHMVMQCANTAAKHSALKHRFVHLIPKIQGLETGDRNGLRLITKEVLEIESDEPTPFRVVDLLSHNELLLAKGLNQDDFFVIPWHKRVLANWLRWETNSIRSRAELAQDPRNSDKNGLVSSGSSSDAPEATAAALQK